MNDGAVVSGVRTPGFPEAASEGGPPSVEAQLRWLLWAVHVCQGRIATELRCVDCAIDFGADPPETILERLSTRSLEFLALAQWHVCAVCGVTRFTREAMDPCSSGTHQWIQPPASLEPHGFDGGELMGLIQCIVCGNVRAHPSHGPRS